MYAIYECFHKGHDFLSNPLGYGCPFFKGGTLVHKTDYIISQRLFFGKYVFDGQDTQVPGPDVLE